MGHMASKLHSGGGGVHDEEADPFAETEEESSPAPARAREGSYEPAPTGIAGGGMGHMANLALSVGGGRGGLPGGRGGLLGGHGGLVGGRLAHPAAQKVGMMAVGGNLGQRSSLKTQVSDTESQHEAGQVSAPEEEKDV